MRIRVFVLYSLVSNMYSRIFARCHIHVKYGQIHTRYGQIHVRYATDTRIPAESDLGPGMVNVFGVLYGCNVVGGSLVCYPYGSRLLPDTFTYIHSAYTLHILVHSPLGHILVHSAGHIHCKPHLLT